MQGFPNPAGNIRKKWVDKITASGAKQNKTVWLFFIIEIIVIIAVFIFQTDRFDFLCKIFGCSPIGGFFNIGMGVGEIIGRGEQLSVLLANWFPDYGQWLLSAFQYTGMMCLLAAVKAGGGNKFLQFIQAVVNTLFSGIVLWYISKYVLFGENGLTLMVIRNHRVNPDLDVKNVWLWAFCFTVLIVIVLAALAMFCLLENFIGLLINTVIVGVIMVVILVIRALMGNRAAGGEATEVEQFIVNFTSAIYSNVNNIYWIAAGVLLVGYALTAVSTTNPKAK